MDDQMQTGVRKVLQKFQAGYTARDVQHLDEFMQLFLNDPRIELIGIGASKRSAAEWFQGPAAIREIIESDWTYWGNVVLDVEGAVIHVAGEIAWCSTTGAILQTEDLHREEVATGVLHQIEEILADANRSPEERLIDAAHFSNARVYERTKPFGYRWPFVWTAVLCHEQENWKFHTIHWSMPVE